MKARYYEIIEEIFNINVNVFGYENRIFPLYVSKKINEKLLNVLLKKMKIMNLIMFLSKILAD